MYGFRQISVELPKKNVLGIVKPRRIGAVQDVETEIKRALMTPIGSDRISKIIEKKTKLRY